MTDAFLGLNIGIIMDGNGRWAKKNHLPRYVGHRKGAEVFTDIVKYCNQRKVNSVVFYAFSTENWKRSTEEVNNLMQLFKEYLIKAFDHEKDNNRVIFIGERNGLSTDLVNLMERIEKGSADKTGMTLYVAVNYGGRAELTSAMKKISQSVKDGEFNPDDITEQTISDSIYTPDMPNVDLIIRPSGEQRLSNFLIWQAAYAEFVYMDVLWPDFTSADLDNAVSQYADRNRRFGGR